MLQVFREGKVRFPCQFWVCHECYAGLPQSVAVSLDVNIGGNRRVGNHEIETMQGKFGEQSIKSPFTTDDADRLVKLDGRTQKSIGK